MKDILVFIHIPKAGGKTLKSIVIKQYGKKRFFLTNNLIDQKFDSNNKIEALTQNEINSLSVIYGHLVFGIHKRLKVNARYITMLRNPVERVISYFYYIKNNPEAFNYDKIKMMDLEDFVESSLCYELSNLQSKMIAGIHRDDHFESEKLYALAKQNIQDYFIEVGIVELFDESLAIFKKKLKWEKPIYYYKKNVNNNRKPINKINTETLKKIEKLNSVDIQLYNNIYEQISNQSTKNLFVGIEVLKIKVLSSVFKILKTIK